MSPDSGLIFGMLVRLATRMGYHRDPDMFPLSAFEREMRRRTWSLCMQLDLLISFQLGLPSNIQYPTWDTRPPKNLQDSDFDEDTKELPPARPDSEVTNILFYIAKHRLMTVFEKIVPHNLTIRTKVSTAVDEIDTEIKETYSPFPKNLHALPMEDSIVDHPSLVVTRLCVSFIYQKSLCVLHRPYVSRGRVYSTQVCYDAAANIVRDFNDMYKEFLPGGQLETERWFMSNITWHDYLFGVIALCVVLCASSQGVAAPYVQPTETLQLLQRAQGICVEQSVRSKDSGRVRRVVNATLLHFEVLGGQNNGDATNESIYSTNIFDTTLLQSPFAGDQASAQESMPPYRMQKFPPEQTEADWAGSENMARSTDDPSWAYLESFLNLSDHDLILST